MTDVRCGGIGTPDTARNLDFTAFHDEHFITSVPVAWFSSREKFLSLFRLNDDSEPRTRSTDNFLWNRAGTRGETVINYRNNCRFSRSRSAHHHVCHSYLKAHDARCDTRIAAQEDNGPHLKLH